MKAEDSKLFSQFFEGNKRQYIVPVYQRNYDWTLDQCNVLFNDIINAYKNDKEHFIGSIVQVQKDEEFGVKPFIVIDGQQRLTTIYLLLAALINYEENNERKEVLEESLFNIFKGDKPKSSDDKFKLKLKANTKDNNNLIKLMNGKLDEVENSSNVLINFNYFKSLIKEAIDNNITAKEIKKGIEKLVCVTISLDERKGDDPQLVFERINSTGLPLELDDLVRNYVLMAEINQEFLFEEYWSKIENLVPKEYRTSFLVDFLQTMTSAQINEKTSYENFKIWALNKTKVEILIILLRFAKYFSCFIRFSNTGDKEVDRILNDMLKIDQGSLYTFLFTIFEDHYYYKIIDITILRSILQLILSYSVRRIVCEVQSKSQKGLYRSLYRRAFENQKDKTSNYYEILVSFMLNQLNGTLDEFPDDNKFTHYLKITKLYRNKKFTRYLLETLENSDSNEKIDTKESGISIEHIMPQNYNNIDWRNSLGSEFEDTYKNYLDTLGNLTLTGYNSSLSDNAFKVKKEKLLNTQTKIMFLNKEFYENDKWTKEEILSRASRLAQKTIGLFQFPQLSSKIYHIKVSNDTFMIDLENGEDPTNTIPVSFEFNGEKNLVKSYQDILKMTINAVYKINKAKIIELSLIDFPLGFSKRSNNPYITTLSKQNLLRRPSQIENTDICFETNLNAWKILDFINDIFKQCNIDSSSFGIYCQKSQES